MWLGKHPIARKGAAIAIFMGAALVQVFFKNIPWPVALEGKEKLRAPAAALASEELVLTGVAPAHHGRLLSYQGNPFETADLDFSNARLGDPTFALLDLFPPPPPTGAGEWHFVSRDQGSASGDTCRTFFEIDTLGAPGDLNELHLFQLGEPGLSRMRGIEIRTDRVPLLVNVKTEWPQGNENRALGCHKRLQSGAWFRGIVNHPLQFIAQPGSTIRINFVALAAGAPEWGGPGKPLQAAALGPLLASRLTVRPIQDDGSPARRTPGLSLSAYRNSRLRVDNLSIASGSFKVRASGKAWATVDGSVAGFDLWEALQKNVMFAALLAALNGLLLAWLRRLFFGEQKRTDTAVKTGPEPAA